MQSGQDRHSGVPRRVRMRHLKVREARHSKSLLVALAMAMLGVVVGTTSSMAGASSPAPASAGRQSAPGGCDPLDPTACLLPFPDNFFTVADPTTPTRRRVDFPLSAMPANVQGVHIDPTEWNRNDGFSPGTPILLHVPGVDLAKTGAAPITDIGASLAKDAPIVLLDAQTGKRWPYWTELDANDPNPAEQALIIRPAADLTDGHRYLVAVRNLKDASGNLIQPNPVFVDYRDNQPPPARAERARRGHMNAVLNQLGKRGVGRSDLYLAWDFTVASTESLTGRMIHMRDDAFSRLGSGAPAFTVSSVTNYTTAEDPDIARHVEGTFSVPSYLDQPGGPPGSRFHLGPDGLPSQIPGNVQTANFVCNIPRAAVADATSPTATVYPGHAMIYGHGLFGSAEEVNAAAERTMANEHDFVVCGTDWLGLSQNDVGADASFIFDFSKFPSLPDRGQQGMLDALFLGRLMTSPGGFDSSPAFQAGSSHPLIDRGGLYYYGNSQGGIQGGALTAVSQQFTRAVLGVPGMDYSLLLGRSVDFTPFLGILDATYPSKLDHQLGYALIQMLWDRSETDGYAEHLTADPLPGTPVHQVLLEEAFGDHQVANVATENEARTIGARVHEPALEPGRSPDVVPVYGVPPVPSDVFSGSALYIWDSGTPAPPTTNTPPTAGADPHEIPRLQPAVRLQDAVFLLQGVVLNVCATSPCLAVPSGG
jgi:hypothetical protein